MKLLVTGASGFVGKALIAELARHGIQIRCALRKHCPLPAGVESAILSSIGKDADWSAALSEVHAVIHLAARVHVMNDTAGDPLTEFRKVNVDGTLNLALQAAQAGVKRFIFISSIKVNGEATQAGKPFTADDIANPQDPYAVSKLEAEQGLLKIAQETGMEVVIIRPPLVYGAGVKANFLSMMRAVKWGLPLPLGAIDNRRSFVYVENLVSLIIKCIEHPAAANQVFLAADGEDLSTTGLLLACAEALRVKVRLVPVPQKLIELGATVIGKRNVAQRLCGNLQLDISKARSLLGWEPPFSVADGLMKTAAALCETDK